MTLVKSNGNLGKTITLSGNSGSFADLVQNGNPAIPAKGVTQVQYVTVAGQ
jgi:hypothetical protein